MKTDKLRIRLSNFHWRLNEFGDFLGDVLGVNEYKFLDPEKRQERQRQIQEAKTIHVVLHIEPEKKKKSLLQEIWEI